ncbi:protein serine/threonine phosphatase [Coriobacterium glomerans PW2]|uniref:Protein serine/threonine phosphatase n=1 Tax=Coriobacterium glomerans (strain ATCC 49209 / DSM 20642 / JCM 10262 / PW2) TaxID=700015 RepID=F2N978_CORGP|nr:Stp1/IreP family PP2C-type Ser/Thr phosphatase [Coriobacterium glomerans]AEB07754.1 protein serine/threonine phosphatase [Coriobacterium glomerans PW2]
MTEEKRIDSTEEGSCASPEQTTQGLADAFEKDFTEQPDPASGDDASCETASETTEEPDRKDEISQPKDTRERAAQQSSPEDTAEIDSSAIETRIGAPDSTMDFEPISLERVETDSTYDAGTTTALMWGARSDVGSVRTHNEDSYLVQSPLFCVCDGMGGHAAGEVASSIAVKTISKTAPPSANPALLGSSVEAANAAIIEAAANGLGKPGMGCTATAAYIEGTTVAIAHVGDSRAYLLHAGTLIRITRDHSYVEELIDAGQITADEARVHPNRSVITRALGSDPAMYADHFQLNIEMGDRLILCSDGLSSMIPDEEIERISIQSDTAQICTDNLVDAALAHGGSDNVTVLVIDVVDDGRLRKILRRRRRNLIIAACSLLLTIAAAVGIAFFLVTNSTYLGSNSGKVAIYSGVPSSFMGLKFSWLQDTTSIKLEDLPEDTRARLQGGIPQKSYDEAMDTISKYRKQIDEEQTRQANDAAAIRKNKNEPEPSADSPATPPSDDATAESQGDPAQGDTLDQDESGLAGTLAPTNGGDAQ